MQFVNRSDELARLEAWWSLPGPGMGIVWGRRRVGKTVLLERFASGRRAVFHTGTGAPAVDELRMLSLAARGAGHGLRDLGSRPFADWRDALEHVAEAASDPLLVVLDEFPELVGTSPGLPGVLRAVWDRIQSMGHLKLLLCGSAVRVMQAMQEARSPLYGRMDLRLRLDPFRPHEAALMLRRLSPSDRAVVWGLVGGMPMYLDAWDQSLSIRTNVQRLLCSASGFLLNEGELVLATEAVAEQRLLRSVLLAIAAGRSKHGEIRDAVGTEPTRVLERLIELRLLERIVPVTEDPPRTRRRMYRIADNFLATWLGIISPHRPEIERGLGATIISTVMRSLDDHMGPRWEEAFRWHLRRLAAAGVFGDDAVAVGPYWNREGKVGEIDAVVLAGRERAATAVGEAKWSRRISAGPIRRELERRAASLPRRRDPLRPVICGREVVTGADPDVLVVTASDIFG